MGDRVAPGGRQIDLVSMNGKLMASMQELSKRVKKIEKRVRMSMIEGVLARHEHTDPAAAGRRGPCAYPRRSEQEDEDRTFAMSERQRLSRYPHRHGPRRRQGWEPVEVKQDRPDTMDDRDVGQPGEEAAADCRL